MVCDLMRPRRGTGLKGIIQLRPKRIRAVPFYGPAASRNRLNMFINAIWLHKAGKRPLYEICHVIIHVLFFISINTIGSGSGSIHFRWSFYDSVHIYSTSHARVTKGLFLFSLTYLLTFPNSTLIEELNQCLNGWEILKGISYCLSYKVKNYTKARRSLEQLKTFPINLQAFIYNNFSNYL